jgi:alpha-beta hydrolase superfamily lysophospholipase
MTINVQFVYGAGSDALFGGGLRQLQADVAAKFKTTNPRPDVYLPRILDYTELETLDRLVAKWNNPTILVGHSCGCMSITRTALKNSMKRIPFLMAIAPSIYCPVVSIANNVKRATQATSWWGDFFNPGGRVLLSKTAANNVTKLDVINTGMGHVQAPYSPAVSARLLNEISLALEGK